MLAKNDLIAERNRQWLAERDILAFNLTSSPGAGKTTLLERTIRDLGRGGRSPSSRAIRRRCSTPNASGATGCRAVQVNTGAGCHLDADMVARALRAARPRTGLVAVHRERREPGVPGAVRSRRARQGRRHLGHRGRGQAAEVSAHVRRGRAGAASTRSICCPTSTSISTLPPERDVGQPGRRSCRCRRRPVRASRPGTSGSTGDKP